MKITERRCDRCHGRLIGVEGAEISFDKHPRIIDLCSGCVRAFIGWVDGADNFVEPAAVKYDEEGCNRWGTKYTAVCGSCGSAMPTNMYGMGSCPACGAMRNPLRSEANLNPPRT